DRDVARRKQWIGVHGTRIDAVADVLTFHVLAGDDDRAIQREERALVGGPLVLILERGHAQLTAAPREVQRGACGTERPLAWLHHRQAESLQTADARAEV